jgi:hypothetical protein
LIIYYKEKKLKKITNRKSILGILFTLVILAAMLVPAMPVSAVSGSWPLTVVGYSSVTLSETDFEALPISLNTWTDTSTPTNTFQGVRLDKLIAKVDGGSPDTLNTSILGTYNIVLTGMNQDGTNFVKTITAGSWSTSISGGDIQTDNLFVANKVQYGGTGDFVDLPLVKPTDSTKNWAPTIFSGSAILSSGLRVGALYRIELTSLPPRIINISAQSQSIVNGATFNETLSIDTNTPLTGWGTSTGYTVTFDASKLTANSVTAGTFFSDYASAHGGTIYTPPAAINIDNTNGRIFMPGWGILGGTGAPTGIGTLAVINFTAQAAANNSSTLISPTSSITVSDTEGYLIEPIITTNGTLTVGANGPDLTVSNISTIGTEGNYTVTFQVNNTGNVDAPASFATITGDVAGSPITLPVGAILHGQSVPISSGSISLSGQSDDFTVTVDSGNTVSEINEGNNTGTGSYSYVAPLPGQTTDVNGDIQLTLAFTQPTAINFGHMALGNNHQEGPLNVKTNGAWQVNVSSDIADGKMTKYGPTATPVYTTSVKLHNSLRIATAGGYLTPQAEQTNPANVTEVVLSSNPLLLCNGVTDGQVTDGDGVTNLGESRTINYNQTLVAADASLASGYVYHIVVSFVASNTGY